MGYRTYIGYMPKKEYNKIKSLTQQELYDFYKESKKLQDETPDEFHIGPYDYGKELYEFGKYTGVEPPKKSLKPFFKKKELKEKYEEYDFHVVNQDFLKYIIDTYKEKIKDYYNEMLTPFYKKEREASEFLKTVKQEYRVDKHKYKFDFSKITDEEQTALFNIIEHVRSFGNEWGVKSFLDMLPYDLERGEEVTTSWKFEYGIFELVRIYKSFDWKKNVMIYYGY